jgi:hypothetical protein
MKKKDVEPILSEDEALGKVFPIRELKSVLKSHGFKIEPVCGYGIAGAGKSTLMIMLERRTRGDHFQTVLTCVKGS